jgi:DNA-binding GntR family transcriptional regulator
MNSAASFAKDISISTSRMTVGENLYSELLTSILNGRFEPGERINDVALARELGISRTPVREALQRLRTLGVVEAEPNRFTRVAVITPEQVRDNWLVWDALLRGILYETGAKVPARIVKAAKQQATAFQKAAKSNDRKKAAQANIDLFNALTESSNNQYLRQAILSAQYLVRLGSPELPESVNADELSKAHDALVGALTSGGMKDATSALDRVRAALTT